MENPIPSNTSLNNDAGGMQVELSTDHAHDIDCFMCGEEIDHFGVFPCGHFMCHICALRVRNFVPANSDLNAVNSQTVHDNVCPVCRQRITRLVILNEPPVNDENPEQFDLQRLRDILLHAELIPFVKLRCDVQDISIAGKLELLTGNLCPLPQCWETDPETGATFQDQFATLTLLKDHLKIDHNLKYCPLCLDKKPVFLANQKVYDIDHEIDQHYRGKCSKDDEAFNGHPICLFCSKRFYDADALLKHMLMSHMSCDLCNAAEFTFTFYKNRAMLIQHFEQNHKVCRHRECEGADIMEKVFATELELQSHMSKVHNVKAQATSLAELGFQFGGSSGSSAAARPSASGAAPMTSSSGHATKIYFDFVTRKAQVVDLDEKTKRAGGGGGGNAAEDDDAPSNNRRGGGRQQQQQQQTKKRSEQSKDPLDPTRVLTKEEINQNNAALKEKLVRYVDAKKFEEIRNLSGRYIHGDLLATEYCHKLQSFFASTEQFDDIFPNFANSLPDARKREGLLHVKAMTSSKEARQHRKNQEEAEEAARKKLTGGSARRGAAAAISPKSPNSAWGSGNPKVPPTDLVALTPEELAKKKERELRQQHAAQYWKRQHTLGGTGSAAAGASKKPDPKAANAWKQPVGASVATDAGKGVGGKGKSNAWGTTNTNNTSPQPAAKSSAQAAPTPAPKPVVVDTGSSGRRWDTSGGQGSLVAPQTHSDPNLFPSIGGGTGQSKKGSAYAGASIAPKPKSAWGKK